VDKERVERLEREHRREDSRLAEQSRIDISQLVLLFYNMN
jgi:hypothetical protein